MQTSSLDDLITEAVYNAPHPLTLEQLCDIIDSPNPRLVATRAADLAADGLMDTLFEDGVTYFVP